MNKTQGYFIAIAIVITLLFLFYGPSANMTHNPTSPNIDFIPDMGTHQRPESSPPPHMEPTDSKKKESPIPMH